MSHFPGNQLQPGTGATADDNTGDFRNYPAYSNYGVGPGMNNLDSGSPGDQVRDLYNQLGRSVWESSTPQNFGRPSEARDPKEFYSEKAAFMHNRVIQTVISIAQCYVIRSLLPLKGGVEFNQINLTEIEFNDAVLHRAAYQSGFRSYDHQAKETKRGLLRWGLGCVADWHQLLMPSGPMIWRCQLKQVWNAAIEMLCYLAMCEIFACERYQDKVAENNNMKMRKNRLHEVLRDRAYMFGIVNKDPDGFQILHDKAKMVSNIRGVTFDTAVITQGMLKMVPKNDPSATMLKGVGSKESVYRTQFYGDLVETRNYRVTTGPTNNNDPSVETVQTGTYCFVDADVLNDSSIPPKNYSHSELTLEYLNHRDDCFANLTYVSAFLLSGLVVNKLNISSVARLDDDYDAFQQDRLYKQAENFNWFGDQATETPNWGAHAMTFFREGVVSGKGRVHGARGHSASNFDQQQEVDGATGGRYNGQSGFTRRNYVNPIDHQTSNYSGVNLAEPLELTPLAHKLFNFGTVESMYAGRALTYLVDLFIHNPKKMRDMGIQLPDHEPQAVVASVAMDDEYIPDDYKREEPSPPLILPRVIPAAKYVPTIVGVFRSTEVGHDTDLSAITQLLRGVGLTKANALAFFAIGVRMYKRVVAKEQYLLMEFFKNSETEYATNAVAFFTEMTNLNSTKFVAALGDDKVNVVALFWASCFLYSRARATGPKKTFTGIGALIRLQAVAFLATSENTESVKLRVGGMGAANALVTAANNVVNGDTVATCDTDHFLKQFDGLADFESPQLQFAFEKYKTPAVCFGPILGSFDDGTTISPHVVTAATFPSLNMPTIVEIVEHLDNGTDFNQFMFNGCVATSLFGDSGKNTFTVFAENRLKAISSSDPRAVSNDEKATFLALCCDLPRLVNENDPNAPLSCYKKLLWYPTVTVDRHAGAERGKATSKASTSKRPKGGRLEKSLGDTNLGGNDQIAQPTEHAGDAENDDFVAESGTESDGGNGKRMGNDDRTEGRSRKLRGRNRRGLKRSARDRKSSHFDTATVLVAHDDAASHHGDLNIAGRLPKPAMARRIDDLEFLATPTEGHIDQLRQHVFLLTNLAPVFAGSYAGILLPFLAKTLEMSDQRLASSPASNVAPLVLARFLSPNEQSLIDNFSWDPLRMTSDLEKTAVDRACNFDCNHTSVIFCMLVQLYRTQVHYSHHPLTRNFTSNPEAIRSKSFVKLLADPNPAIRRFVFDQAISMFLSFYTADKRGPGNNAAPAWRDDMEELMHQTSLSIQSVFDREYPDGDVLLKGCERMYKPDELGSLFLIDPQNKFIYDGFVAGLATLMDKYHLVLFGRGRDVPRSVTHCMISIPDSLDELSHKKPWQINRYLNKPDSNDLGGDDIPVSGDFDSDDVYDSDNDGIAPVYRKGNSNLHDKKKHAKTTIKSANYDKLVNNATWYKAEDFDAEARSKKLIEATVLKFIRNNPNVSEWIRRALIYDVWLPVSLLVFWPHVQYDTGTVCFMTRGEATGVTVYGEASAPTVFDGTLKKISMNFNMKATAIVANTRNLLHFPNAYITRYLSGGGSKPFKYTEKDRSTYIEQNLDNRDYFVCATHAGYQPVGPVLDITGYWPKDFVVDGDNDPQYPGCEEYASFWNWRHAGGKMFGNQNLNPLSKINTVCYRGYQKCRNKITINKGVLGPNIYEGCMRLPNNLSTERAIPSYRQINTMKVTTQPSAA